MGRVNLGPQEPAINALIRRRTVRAAIAATACTVALTAGLAACGTVKQLSAADKVSGAFDKLGAGKSVKAELSVAATADQLVAFGKAIDSPIDRSSAELLSGVTLSVAFSSDKPLKDVLGKAQPGSTPDLDFSYVVAAKGGQPYIDLREVKGKTYLKVDAKGLSKLVGQDPAQVQDMSDSLPPELNVVKDALAGKWISMDSKLMADLAKDPALKGQAGAGTNQAAPTPSMDPNTAKKVWDSFKDVLSKNLTFEDKGKQDGADHVVVSAPARTLAEGLLKSVQQSVPKELPQFGKLPTDVPTDIPNRPIGVDVAIKDGALSSMTFDLAQFTDKAGVDVRFPVKIAFSPDAPAVDAPTGATEITKADVDKMAKAMEDAASGGAGGPGMPGLPGAPGGKPAAPLTKAQISELVAAGMPESLIKQMNQSGMSYQDIKDMMQQQG